MFYFELWIAALIVTSKEIKKIFHIIIFIVQQTMSLLNCTYTLFLAQVSNCVTQRKLCW